MLLFLKYEMSETEYVMGGTISLCQMFFWSFLTLALLLSFLCQNLLYFTFLCLHNPHFLNFDHLLKAA